MSVGMQSFYKLLSFGWHECPYAMAANIPQSKLSKKGRSHSAFHDPIHEATHGNFSIFLVIRSSPSSPAPPQGEGYYY